MSDTLLSYAIGTLPDPPLAGTQATLMVTVDNQTSGPVELSSVAIEVPLGANADDLATTIDGAGSAPPKGWSAAHNTGSDTVTFTPPPGGSLNVGGEGFTLALTSIAVNDQAGETRPVVVTETAAPKGGPSSIGTYSKPVKKFPANFSLSDLTADPGTPIDYHGDVNLMWTGSPGPSYTLERSDRPDAPAETVGSFGPKPEKDLTGEEFVVFTLSAGISVANQKPLVYQKQCVVTIRPHPPTVELDGRFEAGGAAGKFVVTWNVDGYGVQTVYVPEIQAGGLPPDHSVALIGTAAQPLPSRITLEAQGVSGPRTKVVKYVTWGDSASVSVGGEVTSMSVSPDESRVYVASYDWSSRTALLTVHDPLTCLPIGDPIPLDGYPVGLAALPDGTNVHALLENEGLGSLVKIDTGVPPATATSQVQIGSPVRLARSVDGKWAYIGNSGETAGPAVEPTARATFVEVDGGREKSFMMDVTSTGLDLVVAPATGLIYGLPLRFPDKIWTFPEPFQQPDDPGSPYPQQVDGLAADRLIRVGADGALYACRMEADPVAAYRIDSSGGPTGRLTLTASFVVSGQSGEVFDVLPSADGRTTYIAFTADLLPTLSTVDPHSLERVAPDARFGLPDAGIGKTQSADGTRIWAASPSPGTLALLRPLGLVDAKS